MQAAQKAPVTPQAKSNGGLFVPFRSPVAENMNAVRATWAEEFFVAFECEHGEEGADCQNVAQLFSYFRHWCDCNNYPWAAVMQMADAVYRKDLKA